MNSSVGSFKLAAGKPWPSHRRRWWRSKRAPVEAAREKAAPVKRAAVPARRARTQGALALKDDLDWKEF